MKESFRLNTGQLDDFQDEEVTWKVTIPDGAVQQSGAPADSVAVGVSQGIRSNGNPSGPFYALPTVRTRAGAGYEYEFTAGGRVNRVSVVFFSPAGFAEELRRTASQVNQSGPSRQPPGCYGAAVVGAGTTQSIASTAPGRVTKRGQIYPCLDTAEGQLTLSLYSQSNLSWGIDPSLTVAAIEDYSYRERTFRPTTGLIDARKIDRFPGVVQPGSAVSVSFEGSFPESVSLRPSVSPSVVSTLLLLIGRIPSLFESSIYDRIIWEAAMRPNYGKGYQCLSPDIDLTRTTDFATRKRWLSSKVTCVMDATSVTDPFSDTYEQHAFLALTSVIGRYADDIANSLVPMLEEWQDAVGNTPYTFVITTK